MALLDIEDVPEVNNDSNTNGNNGQDTVNLGGPREGHKGPTREKPDPPIEGKVAITELAMRHVLRIRTKTNR